MPRLACGYRDLLVPRPRSGIPTINRYYQLQATVRWTLFATSQLYSPVTARSGTHDFRLQGFVTTRSPQTGRKFNERAPSYVYRVLHAPGSVAFYSLLKQLYPNTTRETVPPERSRYVESQFIDLDTFSYFHCMTKCRVDPQPTDHCVQPDSVDQEPPQWRTFARSTIRSSPGNPALQLRLTTVFDRRPCPVRDTK